MKKALTAVVITTGILVTVAFGRASALPTYSQKEKTTCGTCHVNPAGGGKLTARGEYYKSHGHSFKGEKKSGDAKTTTPTK